MLRKPEMKVNYFLFHICVLYLISGATITNGQDDDNVYTPKEIDAVQKLRAAVGESNYNNYLEKGLTIIHFLRAKDLKVEETKKAIEDTIKWRNENRVDGIENEKLFPDLYPYQFTGMDKMGRPIGYLSPPKWDVRKVIVGGKRDELLRFLIQFHERAHLNILETRNSTGMDVTQFTHIVDVEGYNLRQHACLRCFPLYFAWLEVYEKHYAQDMGHLIFVNVPRIAHPFFELLKPLMSRQTRKVFQIFASDRKEWTRELTKIIDPSQLLVKFGGKRTQV